METKRLIMDGRELDFKPGATILEVARAHGIDIPTLCYLDGCKPTGACRVCVVEVKGARSLVASCSTPAENAPFLPPPNMPPFFAGVSETTSSLPGPKPKS